MRDWGLKHGRIDAYHSEIINLHRNVGKAGKAINHIHDNKKSDRFKFRY